MFVARLKDKNGSTFYTTVEGGLTRDINEAEKFFTEDLARMFAEPSWNGIPQSRIHKLEIRGEAVLCE